MPEAVKHATILLVDDDAPSRYLNGRMLRGAGYEVREVTRATEALEVLAQGRPDLVILDMQLPGMPGPELLQRIRSDPATAGLPAMYLSATFADEASIAYGLEGGADAYLVKPVAPVVLLGQVKALLRLGRMYDELSAARQEAERRAEEAERAEGALRESEEALRLALDSAQMGTFDYRPATGELIWDERNKTIWGLRPDETLSFEEAVQRIHPEDRARARAAVEASWELGAGGSFEHEYRIVWPDGSVHWTIGRGRVHFEGEGERRRAVRMVGIQLDITARKEAEAHTAWLASFPERNPAPITEVDESGRLVYANPAARETLAGLEEEGLQHPWLAGLAEAAAALREGRTVPARDVRIGDRWYQQTLYRVESGCIRIYAIDITARKQAEEGLRERQERLLEAERTRARMAQTLADEVAHRTRNDLAIVAALLQTQLDHQPERPLDPGLVRDAIARIHIFVALHGQLYQTQGEEVELVSALRQMADLDRRALAAEGTTVSVSGEPVRYPSRVGTTLSMVANELVMNALKHGAPDSGVHQVEIRVWQEAGSLHLAVWSSGSPIAPDFEMAKEAKTGLDLVHTVVEDQYGGTFRLTRERGGTRAEIVIDEARLREE